MKNFLSKLLEKHAFCQASVLYLPHPKYASEQTCKLVYFEPDLHIRRVFRKTIPSAGMETCPTQAVAI